MKPPATFVLVVSVTPLDGSVRVTVAPAILACSESKTVPEIEPLVVCPLPGNGINVARTNRATLPIDGDTLIIRRSLSIHTFCPQARRTARSEGRDRI